MTTTATAEPNPLLEELELPAWDRIDPNHVVPAVRQMLASMEEEVAALEADIDPTWDGLLKPLEDLGRPFERIWGPVTHLLSVKNSDPLRKAHETVLPELVAFGLRLQQSEPIYNGLLALRDSDEWGKLDDGQRRVIELKIREAKHAGVGLKGEKKQRFNEIARELSKLGTDFSNNVLDATKAFEHIVTDPADTEGWPKSLKQLAAQSWNDNSKGDDEKPATPDAGPWRITLDIPSYLPFMQHSRIRDQREKLYSAFITRASSGEYDNTQIMNRELELRHEQAELLGFDSYAELSLDSKMAPGVDAVREMYEEILEIALPHAKKDLDELRELATEGGQTEPIAHWDVPFWAERLREKRFDFTDEQLRPYFPLHRVLDGLFGVCKRLFDIDIRPTETDVVPVWHRDVRYFTVHRGDDGAQVASFYFDPYSRPADKRGGAWMDNCLSRRWVDTTLQLPVVHLCCNSTPPVGDIPSLMTFREVETLFHEFGHGLQGMLTTVDYAEVAGVNGVEWDAVEIASQFMENWCYHRPTLLGMTAHYETGEPLPEELFEKICKARTFRAGSNITRQMELGMTDLALHHDYDVTTSDETPFEVHRRIAERTSVLPTWEGNRFLCAFSHIFAGAYSAGYYSYLWADVLSADAFAAFEEIGLDRDKDIQELGRKYRDTILALGGSLHPMDVFKSFRKREPTTEALLRHRGLR